MQTDRLNMQVIFYKNKYFNFNNFADEDGVSSSIDLLINNIYDNYMYHIVSIWYD